jgi:hypothetical protein
MRGVERYGLLEVTLGRLEIAWLAPQEQVPPQQVQVLGGGGTRGVRMRRRREAYLEPLGHVDGDLALKLQHANKRAVVGARPQMGAGRGIDELNGDAQLVARAPHAALEHVGHVQLASDCSDIHRGRLEDEGRAAGNDPQVRRLGQQVENLLGKAIGEVGLVAVRAQVEEAQHRDGIAGIRRLRRLGRVMRAVGGAMSEEPRAKARQEHQAEQRRDHPSRAQGGAIGRESSCGLGLGSHVRR